MLYIFIAEVVFGEARQGFVDPERFIAIGHMLDHMEEFVGQDGS